MTHIADQALDALLAILQGSKGKTVTYKAMQQIIEENSERTMVIRADVQMAIAQLRNKGYSIQTVNGEGYTYTGE